MSRQIFGLILMCVLAVLIIPASASNLTVSNAEVHAIGDTATVTIILDEVPTGLSGFNITVSLSNPAVAEIVNVTNATWATNTDNSPLPADSGWFKAYDGGSSGPDGNVAPGATNVLFTTLTIRGDAAGATAVNVVPIQIDEDGPNLITPTIYAGTFTVELPVVVPGAAFTADKVSGAAPLAVQFTDQSTGAPTSYAWDFQNDGTVDNTTASPSFTYNAAGTYTVNLTVTNSAGSDSEVKAGYITVTVAPPVANFAKNVSSGPAPLAVQFNDTSTGGAPTSWAWDFQDDGTIDSIVQNPIFVYTIPGTYSVSLNVTNAGGSNTRMKPNFIVVSEPGPIVPVVNFIGDNRTGPAPLLVHFTDQSTGNPTSWAWDFQNDGVIDSTDQNTSFTYTSPGIYQVNLTASNAAGSAFRLKGNYINVTGGTPGLPGTDFTSDVRVGPAPLLVHFNDTTTGDPTAWAWDFQNDGVVDSNDQNPTFTFTSPGTYQVNLTATNAAGSRSRLKADWITVNTPLALPVANFTGTPLTGSAPLPVTFNDTSTGADITGYQWTLGDDPATVFTTQNLTHTFTATGLFSVNHSVTNASGTSWKNETDFINVSPHLSRTWTVGAIGCDFTTIGDALGSTELSDDDTIFVYNGTYALSAAITKRITLHGEGKSLVTVETPSLTITGTGATIEGIRFTGGVFALGGTDTTIRDCIIESISTQGGMAISGANVTIDGILFRNNNVDRPIELTGPNCRIQNSTFSSNLGQATQGLIRMVGCSGAVITRNSFVSNGYAPISLRVAGTNNRIYLNNFIGNGGSTPVKNYQGTSPAIAWVSPGPMDYTYNGASYSGVLGNYWGTYTGVDADGNGVGDSSYSLGATNQVDTAPLMTRWNYLFGNSLTLTTITVLPTSQYLHIGETRQFVATGYDELGLVMPGVTFTWASTNATVGTVNETGFFSALVQGETSITAQNGSVSGSASVQVTGSPLANFTANRTTGGAPFPVHFTDTSLSSPTAWAWDFNNDGNIDSTEQNPNYTYLAPGTFSVNLTASNGFGSTNVLKTGYIYVPPVPVANFTASVTSGVTPLFVRFTDTTTGAPSSWLWEFGDGGSSTAQSPMHTYLAEGTYSVNLTVTNGAGSGSENRTGYITVSVSTNGLADTPWPKYQRYNNNTGRSSFNASQTGNMIWNFSTGGAITGCPVIGADGTIYTGSADTKLYAINPNGTEKWNYTTGGAILASPAIRADGTIYVGSGNSLFAINSNGTLKWSYLSDGAVKYSVAIGSDGTIYASMRNKFYAITDTGTSGIVKWSYTTGSGVFAAPTITNDGTIYWSSSNYIWSFNPDGSQNWRFQSPVGMMPKTPAIGSDGTLYLFDGNSLVAMTDGKTTYTQKWRTGSLSSIATESPSLGSDGTIYFGSQASKFWAFTDNGAGYSEKWNYSAGNYIKSPAAVGADGTLYFGCDDSRVYALNPNGTQKWTYLTNGAIAGGLAIGSDGALYVGNSGGKLYAFKDVAPVAGFTGTPVTGDAPLSVQFNDTSANVPTSWSWEFGDTGTSVEKNPLHNYTAPGVYTVNLTVTNNVGSNTVSKANLINVTVLIPEISVIPNNATLPTGSTTQYQLIINTLPDGLAGYNITVSLDNPATGEITALTLPSWASLNRTSTLPADSVFFNTADLAKQIEPGATNILLATITVRGDLPGTSGINIAIGQIDADGGDVVSPIVHNGQLTTHQPLVANFSASPLTGTRPLVVNFTDLSTGDPLPANWSWDFNSDGVADSFAQNPQYTFADAGHFTVNLTVSNQFDSDNATKSSYIWVKPNVVSFPSYSNLPTDPDGDGIYEDVNGNGRLDFDDIVVYYQNMGWIEANTAVGIPPYDFNHNGRIDYDDVVLLYDEVLATP